MDTKKMRALRTKAISEGMQLLDAHGVAMLDDKYAEGFRAGAVSQRDYMNEKFQKECAKHDETTMRAMMAEAQLAERDAELAAMRALSRLPDNYCLACGGTGGHHEGCNGTTGLMALNAELAALKGLAEAMADDLEEVNANMVREQGDVPYQSVSDYRAAYPKG